MYIFSGNLCTLYIYLTQKPDIYRCICSNRTEIQIICWYNVETVRLSQTVIVWLIIQYIHVCSCKAHSKGSYTCHCNLQYYRIDIVLSHISANMVNSDRCASEFHQNLKFSLVSVKSSYLHILYLHINISYNKTVAKII